MEIQLGFDRYFILENFPFFFLTNGQITFRGTMKKKKTIISNDKIQDLNS